MEVAERESNGRSLFPRKVKNLVALDVALKYLEEMSPRQNRVVELRFFGGLEMEGISQDEGSVSQNRKTGLEFHPSMAAS